MTPSKIFLYFCLSFIGGIFVSSVSNFSVNNERIILLVALISAVFLISIPLSLNISKKTGLVAVGFCILFLVLGIWRNQTAESQISESKLQIFNDKEEKINLVGIIGVEPDIKEKSTQLTINTESINNSKIKGKVLVATWKYPEFRYGDKLKIIGKLKTPEEDIKGFNYKNYLQKEGIYSVMDFPKIDKIGENFGNSIISVLFSFKNKFKETARNFISPPEEGILEALVFGDEEYSKEWKDKLNLTGTRHITAVSGMNITIIASLILSLALSFGLWRQQALYLSVFFLTLYILITGVSSSSVRAGIMGGVLLLAQYFGRISQASRAVIFASTFMLAANPLSLRLDVGFQLSFLAILGIIYLQPVLMNFLRKIPNPKFLPFKTILSTTFSAQIFTLPILIYNFGYISLVSPITNILIVPILAPLTILIFLFGFGGMIFPLGGLLLSWPTWLFLSYITKIIDIFSKIPFASRKIDNIPWVWLIIFYIILGALIWKLRKRKGILSIV